MGLRPLAMIAFAFAFASSPFLSAVFSVVFICDSSLGAQGREARLRRRHRSRTKITPSAARHPQAGQSPSTW